MRVLLVDDHQLFMEGLENFLSANDIQVVGTASNVCEALRKTKELSPDIILMDVQMPDGDGIEATSLIKAQFPEIKIVMLTVSQDDNHLFEAIKAGAAGYLLKGQPRDQFLELLAGLERGESPLSPGLASKILAEFARLQRERDMADTAPENTALLSDHQVEILKQVAQGLTYKEISRKIYLSEPTIKYHMGQITKRLQLENRSQVIAFATEMGLISGKEQH